MIPIQIGISNINLLLDRSRRYALVTFHVGVATPSKSDRVANPVPMVVPGLLDVLSLLNDGLEAYSEGKDSTHLTRILQLWGAPPCLYLQHGMIGADKLGWREDWGLMDVTYYPIDGRNGQWWDGDDEQGDLMEEAGARRDIMDSILR